MKLFAMLMLRCALVMLLSSLLQNGTLALNLEEYLKSYWQLAKWENSCRSFVGPVSKWDEKITLDDPTDIHQINQAFLHVLSIFINSFDAMLVKVKEFPLKDEMEVPPKVNNKFPFGRMEERLKRRLHKPLKIALGNCKKLEDKIKQSGLEEDTKNYLKMLSSKIGSIANVIGKEFNTFISEVELELIIKKVKWTSDSRLMPKLHTKFSQLLKSTEDNLSYCNTFSFLNGQIWTTQINKNPPENEKEFVEDLEALILEAKLGILENELSAKIAVFEEQKPDIDGDGFMAFSDYFIDEWGIIKQKNGQLNRINAKNQEVYRKRLDDLAESAMEKTAPLKGIITKKLDELCPGPLKIVFKKAFKSDQKEQKEAQINAKKVINDIGMFDGAANKLLVDNAGFSCAKLKEAVEVDKETLKTAYQVKDKITPTMK
uniref:Uncharacterized protein n=1 Tax=Globodera rostochiensis TaxID=31243 RepID=A0A914HIZ7_GLORO